MNEEHVRNAVVSRLMDTAERAVLADDWETAIESLLSVLEIDPSHRMAAVALDHLTAPTAA